MGVAPAAEVQIHISDQRSFPAFLPTAILLGGLEFGLGSLLLHHDGLITLQIIEQPAITCPLKEVSEVERIVLSGPATSLLALTV